MRYIIRHEPPDPARFPEPSYYYRYRRCLPEEILLTAVQSLFPRYSWLGVFERKTTDGVLLVHCCLNEPLYSTSRDCERRKITEQELMETINSNKELKEKLILYRMKE